MVMIKPQPQVLSSQRPRWVTKYSPDLKNMPPMGTSRRKVGDASLISFLSHRQPPLTTGG